MSDRIHNLIRKLSMLARARLRYAAGREWGIKRYLNMTHLTSMTITEDGEIIEF